MEESFVDREDLKNSENLKSDGRIRYRYKLRRNLASRKSPLGPCQSSSEAISPNQEDPSKGMEEASMPEHAERSNCSSGVKLVGSPETPKTEAQDCAGAGMQAGSVGAAGNNSAKEESLPSVVESRDQPRPAVPAAEAIGGQMPRRYPSRVRVSAVRNFPASCGKDGMNSGKKDSPKTNRSSVIKRACDEKAQMEVAESQSMSGKIENEVRTATRKRKNEEEAHHENKAIRKNEKDSSLHDQADKNFPVDQEARESVVGGSNHTEEIIAREKVREALCLFEIIYMKMLQQEEALQAPDMMAFKLFNEKSKELNNGRKYVGSVPGVEVGDEFNLRVELCIVGLHRQHRLCVDFTNQGAKSVAVSIVYSRPYADGMASSDVFVYSSPGALKLGRGNLELKNSMDTQTPVRVIHGFKGYLSSSSRQTKTKKKIVTYVYDGLYLVEKYWRKKDYDGQYACMFRLRRMPGQPELVLKAVKNSKNSKACSGLCIKDISQGKEKIPIRVVNTIDNEHLRPFKYITKMIYPSQYSLPPSSGCECIGGCSDSESCACAVKNGGEIPFNYSGAIVEAKPLVYECGPSCKCPPSCHNRVSQRGIKFQLEIFKTESMGWGVRSRNSIPSGSFICEYVGELLDDAEADKRTNDEYLFDIGNNYYDKSLWEGLNTSVPDLQKGASCEAEEVGFAVDASEYGNVGRFVNHSCTPNLYAQNLLYDHDNKSMPHVMLFAAEDIPPLQELTYDYNYAIDQVRDSDGNIKKKTCYCGSIECTGRLY